MSNKINAIYSCCIAKPWLEIIDKLYNELNIIPKYFIGWGDGSVNIKNKYKDCYFQAIEDAWSGRKFPKLNYNYPLDENLLRSILREKIISFKMMDRLDLDRYSFSFSDRQVFFYYFLKRWLQILDHYKISLIISPSIPHRVFDYILYVAANIKNIEFIMFQMTPFSDSSFIIDNIDSTPKYIKTSLATNLDSDIRLRKDIFDRIEQVKGEYSAAKPHYMKEQEKILSDSKVIKLLNNLLKFIKNPFQLFEESSTYYVAKNYMPFEKKNKKYTFLYKKYKNIYYLKKLKSKYERLATDTVNYKKYIFIALHYQPEETSVPTGGLFGDQQLIIDLLNSFLDKDIGIIIKEHKTQFHPNFEGGTGRTDSYYENMLKISKRINFVSINENPFKLIDGAIATVTISGTIGWESVIRGTPSIIFGRAWYEDMPGVYKIKTIDDLSNNWKNILKDKNNIKLSDIDYYHKKLQKFLINASHYKTFANKVQRDDKENVYNIFHGIKNHLEKNI